MARGHSDDSVRCPVVDSEGLNAVMFDMKGGTPQCPSMHSS